MPDNGQVERMNRTIKEATVQRLRIPVIMNGQSARS